MTWPCGAKNQVSQPLQCAAENFHRRAKRHPSADGLGLVFSLRSLGRTLHGFDRDLLESQPVSSASSKHFGDRLASAVAAKRSTVCVGLDPRWQSLPHVLCGTIRVGDWAAMARQTTLFCCEVLDAVADLVPIVKPQAAFFEQLGPHGMHCLAEVIQHARQLGLLVLLDGKRGDIGSTAEGYAEAYLGEDSPWQCDALTVNPYLGDDTLLPFFQRASVTGTGIFVLVKTSNGGSRFLQDVPCPEGRIYNRVAATVEGLSLSTQGKSGYGIVGAVTGATYPEELTVLRAQMPTSWLLIPGYGAQGGAAADVQPGFDKQHTGAIVNSSRGIIFAYGQPESAGLNWQNSVRQAAQKMKDELSFVA